MEHFDVSVSYLGYISKVSSPTLLASQQTRYMSQKMKGVFMSVSKPVDIWTTWLYLDLSVSLMVDSRSM